MNNLNTHSIASLCTTFSPQYAKQPAERLEVHYTPKHGSWLNIAELELSALGRQCIANNRIPDLSALRSLLLPWASSRNALQKDVDWLFSTLDAKTKLMHLYPALAPEIRRMISDSRRKFAGQCGPHCKMGPQQ